jgi:hypothetical protein
MIKTYLRKPPVKAQVAEKNDVGTTREGG